MFADISPFAFALFAALAFSFGDQFQAQGVRHYDARAGAALGIGAGTLCFWLLAPWLLHLERLWHPAVLLFAATGLIRPALSAQLAIAAIRYLGPTLSGTLASVSPLFGAAFGIVFLGEVLTWPVALGTGGIIVAVALLAQGGRRGMDIQRTWPLWALALPIGTAMIRSMGHAITKVGMIHVPDPYLATLAAFTVSTVISLVMQSARKSSRLTFRGVGPAWFLTSGAMYAIGAVSLNMALLKGEIVTVIPIVAAMPVFTMMLSVTVFKRERITLHTLAALALVLPSVVAVVVWG